MKKTSKVLAFALAGLMAAPMAMAQDAKPETTKGQGGNGPDFTTAAYKDWTLRCQDKADDKNGGRLCEVVQAIRAKKNNAFLAQMVVGRPAGADKDQFIVQLPLGVLLSAAPELQLDGGAKLTLDYRICEHACVATAALDDKMLSALRGATKPAHLVFRDGGGRQIALPVSLMGFTAAMSAAADKGTRTPG